MFEYFLCQVVFHLPQSCTLRVKTILKEYMSVFLGLIWILAILIYYHSCNNIIMYDITTYLYSLLCSFIGQEYFLSFFLLYYECIKKNKCLIHKFIILQQLHLSVYIYICITCLNAGMATKRELIIDEQRKGKYMRLLPSFSRKTLITVCFCFLKFLCFVFGCVLCDVSIFVMHWHTSLFPFHSSDDNT